MRPARRLALAGLLCAAALTSSAACAQAPTGKPVRIVVPFPPGGAPDILARLLGQRLGDALGQGVVVDNRPGAAGAIGAEAVAKAAPDGLTLLMSTTSIQSINPSLYPALPYDGARDFAPIAVVALTPVILVAANDTPARNLRELIAFGRANPDKLTYATAGAGTVQHIAAVMFDTAAGIKSVHVPYKGTGQLMPDLIAGRVSMMFNSVAAVGPMVKEGKLRGIAVTGARRSSGVPDVPTFAEAGLPGYEPSSWYAVLGPAGLPRDQVARLNAALVKVVTSAEVRERYAALGLDVLTSTPDELARLIRDDAAKWGAVIKANNITAQ
ncbi:MAG: tripartite tricarboxylate transporter substrate binding protein [Burkholderiales bacterium]|nr:tripartite tricarboxylate transporter substrate binding protein [Burkholderiales bacterium]